MAQKKDVLLQNVALSVSLMAIYHTRYTTVLSRSQAQAPIIAWEVPRASRHVRKRLNGHCHSSRYRHWFGILEVLEHLEILDFIRLS